MIYLLWPTIRPNMMQSTHEIWHRNSKNKNYKLLIAVNNQSQKDAIHIKNAEIIISGETRGVTHACNELTKNIEPEDNDIIVLTSDDMYAPQNWDAWLERTLKGKHGALLVNDGYISQDSMTIPIMTGSCFKSLNKIIYHPSYIHQYSDTELYHNLKNLDLLINARKESPVFEHKNWANNKRNADNYDQYYIQMVSQDANNWSARSSMPIEERLKL